MEKDLKRSEREREREKDLKRSEREGERSEKK